MNYELSMFLSPKINDQEAEKRAKEVDKILEKLEAKVLEANFYGMKDLAYPIQHFKQGYFFVVKIEAEPEMIKRIKNRVADELQVIRILVTKQEKDVKLEVKEKIDQISEQKAESGQGMKKEKNGLENKGLKIKNQVTELKASDERENKTKIRLKEKPKEETDLDRKLDKILEEDIVD